jgi:hypothetical protein
MSEFILAFIISAVCGLLFGLGAFVTALKAGGPLATPEAATGAAFRIGYKEYSLSTGNALVALVALSLLCITIVPSVVFWAHRGREVQLEARDTPIYLKARFAPPLSPMTIADDNTVSVTTLNLKLCKTDIASTFTVSADNFHSPVIISASYDFAKDAVIGEANGMDFTIPLNGHGQAVIPTVLAWPTSASPNLPTSLSKTSVSKTLRLRKDPIDITNASAGGQSP